jgi:hypothetical protein
MKSPGVQAGGSDRSDPRSYLGSAKAPRLRRHYRRACGRSRRGRRVALDDGPRPRHQRLPHDEQPHEKLAPGIAGVVEDGILPGYFGYETGQASVGDAFAWLVETFNLSHKE